MVLILELFFFRYSQRGGVITSATVAGPGFVGIKFCQEWYVLK